MFTCIRAYAFSNVDITQTNEFLKFVEHCTTNTTPHRDDVRGIEIVVDDGIPRQWCLPERIAHHPMMVRIAQQYRVKIITVHDFSELPTDTNIIIGQTPMEDRLVILFNENNSYTVLPKYK